MAHGPVFQEWQRDLGSQREQVKIGLNDLRSECEKEHWFLPGKHRQRLYSDGDLMGCWAIALDTFPFASDFAYALGMDGNARLRAFLGMVHEAP